MARLWTRVLTIVWVLVIVEILYLFKDSEWRSVDAPVVPIKVHRITKPPTQPVSTTVAPAEITETVEEIARTSWECQPQSYVSPTGHEVYDAFYVDGKIYFIGPRTARSMSISNFQCLFPFNDEYSSIQDIRIDAMPDLTVAASCSVPKPLGDVIKENSITVQLVDRSANIQFPQMTVCTPDGPPKKFYLSMCTIFKNEGIYLREWLEYYLMLGVEHFFLYDNNSTDISKDVVQPYVDKGIVTYIPMPFYQPQLPMLQHCKMKFGPLTDWMMVCDIDEFLFPKKASLLSILDEHLNQNAGALIIPTFAFGTSGHKKRPTGLVIDNYLSRGPNVVQPRHKYIIKPSEVGGLSVHMVSGSTKMFDPSELVFYHYFTKSEEDWEVRLKKGTVNGYFVPEPPYLPDNPKGEQIPDDSLKVKYSEAMHERMKRDPKSPLRIERHKPN